MSFDGSSSISSDLLFLYIGGGCLVGELEGGIIRIGLRMSVTLALRRHSVL